MRGLLNLGNTCYFNTALQCLLYTPVITNWFLTHGYTGECSFTHEYNKLVRDMWKSSDTSAIHPGRILGELRSRFSQFRGFEPNDVQEVVLCIIDVFEKSLGDEWIKKHLYGKSKSTVTWSDGSSETSELFACRMLEQDEHPLSIRETKIQGYVDAQNNTWDEATIRVSPDSLGTILMVSFNMYNSKNNVTLPLEFSFGGKIYKLFSAALHLGSHLGGHYAAIVCHKGKWVIKDDCTIIEINEFRPEGPYYFAMYKRLVSP